MNHASQHFSLSLNPKTAVGACKIMDGLSQPAATLASPGCPACKKKKKSSSPQSAKREWVNAGSSWKRPRWVAKGWQPFRSGISPFCEKQRGEPHSLDFQHGSFFTLLKKEVCTSEAKHSAHVLLNMLSAALGFIATLVQFPHVRDFAPQHPTKERLLLKIFGAKTSCPLDCSASWEKG